METYAIFSNLFFTNKPGWMPQKLYQVVKHRSNPRTREYMATLLLAKHPNVAIVEREQLPSHLSKIILLYPDAIGLGWSPIEQSLRKKCDNISVLNGRGRNFPLSCSILSRLRLKRFLEITFLPEFLLTPFILIIGAALALKYKLDGRS